MWNFTEMVSSPLAYLLQIISLLIPVLLLVHMHYDAKYRNTTLSVLWYICGIIFPFVTIIVYISKRKKFPAPETKTCSQCGKQYPEGFTMCNSCLIELPANNENDKDKQRKVAATTFLSFWIFLVISTSLTGFLGINAVSEFFDVLDEYSFVRPALTDENGDSVYYDKMGNKYDDPFDVIIYGENGEKYIYLEEELEDLYFSYYVDENGKKYESTNCYVNEDGFFVYNEELELLCDDDPDYNDAFSEDENDTYMYYENPYVDENGDLYYWAEEAIWNEKGELITAENDPTITE